MQIRQLLLRFGILSQVHAKRSTCNGKLFHSWRLFISDNNSVLSYWNNIGFIGKKALHRASFVFNEKTNIDSLPMEYWDVLKERCKLNKSSLYQLEKNRLNLSGKAHVNPHYKRRFLTRSRLSKYSGYLQDDILSGIAHSDIYWDAIKTIEDVGEKQTYDLTIPDKHNFVANDIFVHNTQIMFDITENVVEQGYKVLFCSAEMAIRSLLERKIARELRVDIRMLRKHVSDESILEHLMELSGKVSEQQVYYLPKGVSSQDIYNEASKMKSTIGLDIVFVDYLQILRDCWQAGRENKTVLVGRACKVLKSIVDDLKVPVVCASQLNRDIEHRPEDQRRPGLSDLRESGDIEQDSDVVFLLYRDMNNTDQAVTNTLEIKMAKNRQLGDAPAVNLVWLPEQHKYVDAYRK